jgi:hypothetical protein
VKIQIKNMPKVLRSFIALSILTSCGPSISIEGFDKDVWQSAPVCSEERIALAMLVEANETDLLSATQPQIEALLGPAPRHELFNRNEKFFYYPIEKDCQGSQDRSLFFRFDALGRAKEVIIIFD